MATVNGTIGNDVLNGTNLADKISGLAGDDTLNGLDGNDTLDGGLGADTMTGGLGDDVYVVDDAGDVVNENAGEGRDRVQASISYMLGADVEDLTLTGTASINGTGNALNNTIIGNNGANIIDGGAGADFLQGGGGNDTYIVDDAGDTIKDTAGVDTVESSVSYILPTGVENITLTGVDDINATGNKTANILTGNAGNNILDGGAGNDTMIGGAGDDTYIIDKATDIIVENAGEGVDTVQSIVTYTLGAELENLTLAGTGKINGTGNALDNVLTGNAGDNILSGLDGNDTLSGGAGKDTLIGGVGDDLYIVDDLVDLVVENVGEGTDTMQVSISRTLADNVENLILAGVEAINGTGNALDNAMTGNAADNIIDGGLGADVMSGGDGDDTYIVDNAGDVVVENAAEGEDTVRSSVSYTLGADIENIILTGTADIDATGNAGNNRLMGNSGANVLTGGMGNDTYIINDLLDTIVENGGGGIDTVETSMDYTLGAEIENLVLTGAGNLSGTGNAGANNLTGNGGNNTLDGAAGADNMAGGAGDDTYIVDDVNDVIVENDGEGEDTVQSSVSYTLSANVEHLTLTGAGDLDGAGNALDNIITGTAGNNILDGGAGADILVGGDGDDTYVVDNLGDALVDTSGVDLVQASVSWVLETGFENLELTGTADIKGTGNAADNNITGNDGDNVLDGGAGVDTLTGGLGDDTYVIDTLADVIVENADEGVDTVVSALTYTLGNHLDNLTLSGTAAIDGTGNALNNVMTGNSAANVLTGGAGDDIYVVDNIADTIVELGGGGIDEIRASISFTLAAEVENLTLTGISALNGTGNGLDNILTGNSGANTLDGGAGNDTMDGGEGVDTLIGGAGDDIYIVDNADDRTIENPGEGIDTVQSSVSWTLGNNIENLELTGTENIDGTGNILANTILGNSGNNVINGGAGADMMDGGGGGDDTFYVDNLGDVVVGSGGKDMIISSVNYTMGVDQDDLTLTGAAVTGTGNALDNVITGNDLGNTLSGADGNDTLSGGGGNDALTGGVGDDTLDGGTGIDVMTGGEGDDTYYVDHTSDVATELLDEGLDKVYARATYTLGANLEELYLTGASPINGTGNDLDNIITGNDGRNILTGGAGNDTLDGGLGEDILRGGLGDDIYVVDNIGDVVQEVFGEGTDLVKASVTFSLAGHIENLTLTGDAAINGNGNNLNNVLTGNDAANVLFGDAGDDVLDGGLGADTMSGGTGNDTFYVDDVGDIVIDTSGANDKVIATVSYVLGDGIEALELGGIDSINGTGNGLNNIITGNEGDNRIDGGSGADTMAGGDGNDTYVVDNINDVVVEFGNVGDPLDFTYTVGTVIITVVSAVPLDIVESSVSYTLPANVEVVRLTGTLNINATGNALNNILAGNAGSNTLTGGLGNDAYVITDNKDTVVENFGEGIDTAFITVNYTLGANMERIVAVQGAGNVNATGNNLDNYLEGNEGINVLNGGAGDDIYKVGAGDTIIDSSGYDSVIATVSWVLGAGLEELALDAESGDINGTGNNLDNIITGNDGANILDGSAGADLLLGGLGDDTYVIDNVGDVAVEFADEGIDTVRASINYVLDADFENLILTGTGNIDGTGNSLDNRIEGNSGNNVLTGGLGDDTYVVNNGGDTVVELVGEGVDTVLSSVNHTLSANVENLTLTGVARINATGNALNNNITGNDSINELYGAGGNDTLDGGKGADKMFGGTGDDVYIVDDAKDTVSESVGEGIDRVKASVNFTLSNNVEELELTGEGNISATGNALDNYLLGNAGNNVLTGGLGNDTLDGFTGADRMDGGAGDDTYYVDDLKDIVKDTAGGIDTVYSEVDFTIAAGIENLVLVNGDTKGVGNQGANTITGSGGNNIIDGGKGADIMDGGAGNDTYYVDDLGDVVLDSGGAEDHVISSVAYVLGADIERLTLSGNGAIDGTGNASDNIITGNGGRNRLFGLDGNDTIDGGKGDDIMAGGDGDDIYYVDNTKDIVTELLGEGIDTVHSTVSYVLGDHVENLTLSGKSTLSATGNAQDNILTGNDGANTMLGGAGSDVLNGGLGADKMSGGLGDDVYYVDNAKDIVTELVGEGIDTVFSTVTYALTAQVENLTLTGEAHINATGNNLNNRLRGNDGNNTLNGGAGIDDMAGGLGNDTYYVDHIADTVLEFADEGFDTVYASTSYDLFVNIETLILTGVAAINGTGNVLDNIITGNAAANTLSGLDGNDRLDGGAGDDVLIGGAGDDVYVVDSLGDVVVEVADEGIDTVESAVTYALGFQVENLTLTGKGKIDGTGNDLDNVIIGNTASNILIGGLGNDTLDGGAGTDTMTGGLGDDTYVIDSTKDVIIEQVGEGVDTVVSSVTYTLGAHFENLTLIGTGKINATGNAGNNVIVGNNMANIITGGLGADTMRGGGGDDKFYVDDLGDTVSELENEGVDSVFSSVSFALGAHIENLTLTGVGNIDATGNDLNNVIVGTSGNNVLDGGAGADKMDGGIGDDTYIVDNIGDTIKDSKGVDIVVSSISWTLQNGLENLTLSGGADISGTGNTAVNILTGNDGDNILDGGSGNDTLIGGLGNDRLIGGAGIDTMSGGDGDDVYVIDVAGDIVIENGGEGVDTVESKVAYTLGANIENLVLTGTGSIAGTGNALDNELTGSSGANTLSGLDGNDTLYGLGGNDILFGGDGDDILYGQDGRDTLNGGAGADVFVFEALTAYKAQDIISDFTVGDGDAIDVRDLLVLYDPLADALDTFVRFNPSGANDSIMQVDRDGAGTAFGWSNVAMLEGVNGLADVDTLVLNGNLLAS